MLVLDPEVLKNAKISDLNKIHKNIQYLKVNSDFVYKQQQFVSENIDINSLGIAQGVSNLSSTIDIIDNNDGVSEKIEEEDESRIKSRLSK